MSTATAAPAINKTVLRACLALKRQGKPAHINNLRDMLPWLGDAYLVATRDELIAAGLISEADIRRQKDVKPQPMTPKMIAEAAAVRETARKEYEARKAEERERKLALGEQPDGGNAAREWSVPRTRIAPDRGLDGRRA